MDENRRWMTLLRVEEQEPLTEMHNLEKDIDLAISESKVLQQSIRGLKERSARIKNDIQANKRTIHLLERIISLRNKELKLTNRKRIHLYTERTRDRDCNKKIMEKTNAELEEQQVTPMLRERGLKALEEEHKALLSEESKETEFLRQQED